VEGARQNLEIEATLDSISSHTTQAVIAPLARTDQLGPSLRVVRTPSGAPRASRTAPRRAEACGSGRAGLAAVVRVHAPWACIDMLWPPAERARAVGQALQVEDG
jgi:hypothetical protein